MALAGLVSYDTSDESENENETEITVVPNAGTRAVASTSNGPVSVGQKKTDQDDKYLDNLIDDEAVDDGFVVGPSLPSGLALPKPKYSDTADRDVTTNGAEVQGDSNDVAKRLAALPKANKVADKVVDNLDDEVEEEFRKLPKNAELPKPAKKSSAGKIKISLPDLPTYDSDEDDQPKAKKPKPSAAGKSGLIGMLPQPKNFIVKETNRPLVPHTLSKKSQPQAAKPKPKPTPKSKPKLVDVGSDDSDDEAAGESLNFFSLDKKLNAVPSVSSSSNSGDMTHLLPRVEAQPQVQEPTEAPLEFGNSKSGSSRSYGSSVGPSRPAGYQFEQEAVYPSPQDYCDQEYYQDHSGAGPSVIDLQTQQKLIQDEQFQRMAGKKFREAELMDIMEVRADDQMASQIDITKTLTEEKSNVSYSKKRKDLPSRLSRQKHQITYLAFQAKERELELKNQWSQNKMTKRQTQAKYGF